jgi:hypothetical protein
MTKIFASFLVTFALSVAMPTLVAAQESSSRQYGTLEGQHENQGDEVILDTEHTGLKPVVVKPDTLFNRAGTKKTASEQQKISPKKGEDEAPFNFLYYIIQRFKASDIIEE